VFCIYPVERELAITSSCLLCLGGWLIGEGGLAREVEGLGFLDCKVGRKEGIYFNLMHVLILSMDLMGDDVL
jgi:hypothetical protein